MKKFLIVIDMQNNFITGRLGTPESRAIVPAVVEKIKNHDGAIYVTQDVNPWCDETSADFPVYPPIQAALPEDAVYFVKRTFGSVDLVQSLHRDYSGLDTLDADGNPLLAFEFCGVCTHVFVISNALMLRAFLPKAKITVDSSCCAGLSPELHQAGLDVMRTCKIEVI